MVIIYENKLENWNNCTNKSTMLNDWNWNKIKMKYDSTYCHTSGRVKNIKDLRVRNRNIRIDDEHRLSGELYLWE